MISIAQVLIEVNTAKGLYGTTLEFKPKGLNIIRGNNNSGKSSVLQSILYALGMEELLGATGAKTMQSVLKDALEDDLQERIRVLSSDVYLELRNARGEYITVRRSIKSENRNTKLVDVYKGRLLSAPEQVSQPTSMYVHDSGAAKDVLHGFHAYLEAFIGWELPMITNMKGNKVKLYLQALFPAFFIEQKMGWSDFLATVPYYGVRDSATRAIEFLLGLDVLENDLAKQEIGQLKQDLNLKWGLMYEDAQKLANKAAGAIHGVTPRPEIISDWDRIIMTVNRKLDDQTGLMQSVGKYILELRMELDQMQHEEVRLVGAGLEASELKLNELEEELKQYSYSYERQLSQQTEEREKLKLLKRQLVEVRNDLRKNRAEKKLIQFGSEQNFHLAAGSCPTCHQAISDALFPEGAQKTMDVEENIKYLVAQEKMLEAYIRNQDDEIVEREELLRHYKNKISDGRLRIRGLKKELVSDERMPSVVEIENRIRLKNRIEFYESVLSDLDNLKDRIAELVSEYRLILMEEQKIPAEYFSESDETTLKDLSANLRRLLKAFGYGSKPVAEIKISEDKYLPSVGGLLTLKKEFDKETKKDYDIRYDSSASDFVRAIWGYTCSLYLASTGGSGNHPGLIVMDEPEQHSMSDDSIRVLLKELSSYSGCQSIVAASFHNSDDVYRKCTEGVNFHPIHIKGKFIKAMY